MNLNASFLPNSRSTRHASSESEPPKLSSPLWSSLFFPLNQSYNIPSSRKPWQIMQEKKRGGSSKFPRFPSQDYITEDFHSFPIPRCSQDPLLKQLLIHLFFKCSFSYCFWLYLRGSAWRAKYFIMWREIPSPAQETNLGRKGPPFIPSSFIYWALVTSQEPRSGRGTLDEKDKSSCSCNSTFQYGRQTANTNRTVREKESRWEAQQARWAKPAVSLARVRRKLKGGIIPTDKQYRNVIPLKKHFFGQTACGILVPRAGLKPA